MAMRDSFVQRRDSRSISRSKKVNYIVSQRCISQIPRTSWVKQYHRLLSTCSMLERYCVRQNLCKGKGCGSEHDAMYAREQFVTWPSSSTSTMAGCVFKKASACSVTLQSFQSAGFARADRTRCVAFSDEARSNSTRAAKVCDRGSLGLDPRLRMRRTTAGVYGSGRKRDTRDAPHLSVIAPPFSSSKMSADTGYGLLSPLNRTKGRLCSSTVTCNPTSSSTHSSCTVAPPLVSTRTT